jgi:restriction endonuclease S subunit
MQPLLSHLADIRTGLTMRGPDASRRTDKEGLHLLRISDITENGRIEIASPHLLDRALADDSRYRVARNDLVIANRGTRMTAALVPEGLEAIASGQLFIVRPHSDRITPEFLHWFLNLATTQDRLRAQSCGSYVKTLPVTALRELPVPLIPLELQTKLCALADLARRERELLRLLAEKRGILLQHSFSQILNRFTT